MLATLYMPSLPYSVCTRLNGLLLVFILLWAVSTYIFNVAFAFLNWKLGKDMEIWEMVGLWHYPIPGFFLLAQFCLGILVALGNLGNLFPLCLMTSVFLCLSDGQPSSQNSTVEVEEETKVLIVATIAWGLHKSSRAIMLALIFLIAMKPGFIHAMWGEQAGMFPGQKHSDLSLFLGFSVFKPGFWGLESGLRGKVLVIAACTLQYNVFRWLEKMPSTIVNKGKWEEPCPLFVSEEDDSVDVSISNEDTKPLSDSGALSVKREGVTSNSWPFLTSGLPQASNTVSSRVGVSDGGSKYSFGYIWGSTKESHKWNKKRILALRKERFETQKTLLKIHLKFWMENLFTLFGLEINMIALLHASFVLLNAISMLYIALLAACVLLGRHIIRFSDSQTIPSNVCSLSIPHTPGNYRMESLGGGPKRLARGSNPGRLGSHEALWF
uniref:Piezo-type mechanosensitive ion channel homolog domain-containing protein n=1 Tax=Fagus sylvatica TaxID=28930 RepID=A0A2N9GZF8_FAGSY